MRVLFLINANAASVTARAGVVIGKALSADHKVEVGETRRRGDAQRLASQAAADELDAVVALGGDGTINEAANGLAGSHTALGILPGGSTNVFARTVGFANDPIHATGQLMTSMAENRIRRVGLGNVDGRRFLFHLGIGIDAAIVARVERHGALKRWAGHPWFVYAGLRTYLTDYDRKRPLIRVTLSDGRVLAPNFLTVVQNTNPYSFLGDRPLDVAPHAGFDSPLSVFTIKNLRPTTAFGLVASALGTGRHLRESRFTDYIAEIDSLTVHADAPVPTQVDGELLGDRENLLIRHEPEILDLFFP